MIETAYEKQQKRQDAFLDQRRKDIDAWEKHGLDYKFLESLGATEAKMILLGRVYTGKTVTLEDATKLMYDKCETDAFWLCERRAKAFMKLYVK